MLLMKLEYKGLIHSATAFLYLSLSSTRLATASFVPTSSRFVSSSSSSYYTSGSGYNNSLSLFNTPVPYFIFRNIIMPTTRSGKSSTIGTVSSSPPLVAKRGHGFSIFAYNPESAPRKQGNDINNEDNEIKGGKRDRKSDSYDTESFISTTKSPEATKKTTKKQTPKNTSQKTTKPQIEANTHSSPSTPINAKKKVDTILKTPSPKKNSYSIKTPPSSSRKRKRIEPGSLEPPNNWESIYTLVEELRADRTAPMDYDGGQALPERHRGDKVYRYQVLTALMLSSQTKDAVVGDAMRALQRYGLDVESIRDIEVTELSKLIGKVGFYNNKTKFMKETADILLRDYGGDIPPTAEEMMKLPGIGPKMAYIIESIVYQKSTGIGVDTHMHRIFNELKWVNSKTPEQTREQLEGWLPKDKWGELNALFVGFGQESQQQKEKILKKALECSRPIEALKLLSKVGVDVKKEGIKYGLQSNIDETFSKG